MFEFVFHLCHHGVLDSDFCVLTALIELKKRVILLCHLLKRGTTGLILSPGFTSLSIYGENTCWIKEPKYIMQIMTTGGDLYTVEGSFSGHGIGINSSIFNYAKPVKWWFRYWQPIDDNNNLCHAVPSIEGTWQINYWPIFHFSFITTSAKIKIYLILCHFVNTTKNQGPQELVGNVKCWNTSEFCDTNTNAKHFKPR